MHKALDDRNRELYFARAPQRVVSLVPSDTETLFALGVWERVVGRTEYCVEPADRVDDVPAVGGTKDVDVDAVAALAPDLVIANQEENARSQLEKLVAMGLPVLISFPKSAADAVAHVARVARILEVQNEPAARAVLRRGYAATQLVESLTTVSVFVPIWRDPLMTFTDDTFGGDMLQLAGATNAFADRDRRYPLAADLGTGEAVNPGARDIRYPRVTIDEVASRSPALVLLPDEPYAFSKEDGAYFASALPGTEIRHVDGKDLFWFGARIPEAIARLREVIASHL